MAHEIAKLVLEKAGTFLERVEAVQTALSLGMSLQEIESYLDWHDNICSTAAAKPSRDSKPEEN